MIGSLEGREWVLLGAFDWGTKDQIRQYLVKHGIRVAGSVKESTQFLVCGKVPPTERAKILAAYGLGVPLVDEQTMWRMLSTGHASSAGVGWLHVAPTARPLLALCAWRVYHGMHGLTAPEKPRVTVIRAQGKPLIVLRVGPDFVSSFNWDTLMRKVWLGSWKKIADTTLADRLPEDA